MQSLKFKLVTGAAAASLLATAFAPVAFAADPTLVISGNGNDSDNTIVVDQPNVTVVGQFNGSVVLTGAFSSASTGGNTANGNTGGATSVKSGNATSNTKVVVTGSSNTATVDPCPCDPAPADILVSGNGNKSDNKVIVKKPTVTLVGQGNLSFVGTLAASHAKTGKNKANNNTGAGPTTVTSGNSVSKTKVIVSGSTNTLNP